MGEATWVFQWGWTTKAVPLLYQLVVCGAAGWWGPARGPWQAGALLDELTGIHPHYKEEEEELLDLCNCLDVFKNVLVAHAGVLAYIGHLPGPPADLHFDETSTKWSVATWGYLTCTTGCWWASHWCFALHTCAHQWPYGLGSVPTLTCENWSMWTQWSPETISKSITLLLCRRAPDSKARDCSPPHTTSWAWTHSCGHSGFRPQQSEQAHGASIPPTAHGFFWHQVDDVSVCGHLCPLKEKEKDLWKLC